MKYWNQEEYIGIGPSAHSFLGAMRYSNPSDLVHCTLNDETEVFERKLQEFMTNEDMIFEYIMLRLRLTEGLKLVDFTNKFSVDFKARYGEQLDHLTKNNLIQIDDQGIRLTKRGMDISNYVFEQF